MIDNTNKNVLVKFKLDYKIKDVIKYLDSYNSIRYGVTLKEFDLYSELNDILETYELENNYLNRSIITFFYKLTLNSYTNSGYVNKKHLELFYNTFKEYKTNDKKFIRTKNAAFIKDKYKDVFYNITSNFSELQKLVASLVENQLEYYVIRYSFEDDSYEEVSLNIDYEYLNLMIDKYLHTNEYKYLYIIFPCDLVYNKDLTYVNLLISILKLERL